MSAITRRNSARLTGNSGAPGATTTQTATAGNATATGGTPPPPPPGQAQQGSGNQATGSGNISGGRSAGNTMNQISYVENSQLLSNLVPKKIKIFGATRNGGGIYQE